MPDYRQGSKLKRGQQGPGSVDAVAALTAIGTVVVTDNTKPNIDIALATMNAKIDAIIASIKQ